MEDNLNLLAPASPELGTAQPLLVLILNVLGCIIFFQGLQEYLGE